MNIKAGLVGLPNVGKSTLFNALTKSSVPAENYPFCTIDPHVAITIVPDKRIDQLQNIYKSQKTIFTTINFVDIAGLVKGAAAGQGLGNQFLSHIREVDLIIHVIRCFDDKNIIHTESKVDPIGDFEIIQAELMLKDLESVQKRLEKVDQLAKGAQAKPAVAKELQEERNLLKKLEAALNQTDANLIRTLLQESPIKTIPLLSGKKYLIVANVSEHELEHKRYEQNPHYQQLVKRFGNDFVVPVCAKLEYELSQLSDHDAHEIIDALGLQATGLETIIQQTYRHLDLITFFTCGPQEIHAWPLKQGTTVREAAGTIHSDLQRGFICADVFNYRDLIQLGNQNAVKEKGKLKIEGQDYVVHDGDIIHVKFNV